VHLPISSGIQDLQRLRGAPVGQIKTKGHLAPSQVEAGFTALLGCTCKPTLKGRIYSTLGCTCQGFCVFSFVRRDNGIPRGTVSFFSYAISRARFTAPRCAPVECLGFSFPCH
jgi:hypothetical protein